ncbi:hypothetical protein J14TS2_53350 [Bacillus sp. J14TS2]|nr:hypothetical protein J14TS2_53350 [Bacillus sp. J14TS2]
MANLADVLLNNPEPMKGKSPFLGSGTFACRADQGACAFVHKFKYSLLYAYTKNIERVFYLIVKQEKTKFSNKFKLS